jgi:hypothetical protein
LPETPTTGELAALSAAATYDTADASTLVGTRTAPPDLILALQSRTRAARAEQWRQAAGWYSSELGAVSADGVQGCDGGHRFAEARRPVGFAVNTPESAWVHEESADLSEHTRRSYASRIAGFLARGAAGS